MVCITTAAVIRYPHLPARTGLARIKYIELLTSHRSPTCLSYYNSNNNKQGKKGLQDSLQLSQNGAKKDKNCISSGWLIVVLPRWVSSQIEVPKYQ
ncbi:hypothetical protein B9Z19DRAFT_1075418 [Tuber borchii]|uniref:Uncharacterized protein n=1 Tax=Tuber borchii TaxID=42251 RepID=A0A2T7A364_TUBBO|nr:hypothetical protein B9Z19DRAFT_1075418 [Tuber borchii]